jgi:uncharacterized protein
MPPFPTLAFLTLAAFLAGFVDAAVGGGGLVQIPALLIAFPSAPVTSLLGTNKLASFAGTSLAAAQFVRARALDWREMVGPAVAATLGSAGGVALTYLFERRFEAYFRPIIVGLMVVMLAFTLWRPELGREHSPRLALRHQRGLAVAIAALMGLYDGFFGPGVGTMLIFVFVTMLGFDFLRASALAKAVNWASNVAAVVLFGARGSFLLWPALCMAAANAVGGYLGARTALAKGNRWLRLVFIAVVSLLILRLGGQALGVGAGAQ